MPLTSYTDFSQISNFKRWARSDGQAHGPREPHALGRRRDAHRFHARLLQHEYDHLDGMLYPMRMEDIGTLGYVSELGPAAYPPLPRDAADFLDPT